MAKLTTTTYTILGLLARRSWSAYELTKYMQHSGIRAVWPRTESRIYLEFKNLVAHQLATAQEETHQGRRRSIYSITKKGRTAFTGWLKTAEGGLRIESESLLKLLYCDLVPSALDTQLVHMRERMVDEAQAMLIELNEALEQGFYFDENAHYNAQLVQLLTELLSTRAKWLLKTAQMDKKQRKRTDIVNESKQVYRDQIKQLKALVKKLEQ